MVLIACKKMVTNYFKKNHDGKFFVVALPHAVARVISINVCYTLVTCQAFGRVSTCVRGSASHKANPNQTMHVL